MHEEPYTEERPATDPVLSDRQVEVLQVLYKFRFATAQLISTYQHQSTYASNARLQGLVEQEFVGRSFGASSHQRQLAAIYFLLPKGIRYLKTNTEVDNVGLRLSYNNRKLKSDFIAHSLRIFRAYLLLDDLFQDDLEFYSNSELAGLDNFPEVRPDAYMRFTGSHAATPHCIVELIESSSSRARTSKRVLRFLSHYEAASTWHEAYPLVLLICDSDELEQTIANLIQEELRHRNVSHPRYFTTTIRAFSNIKQDSDALWRDVRSPATKLAFKQLSSR